MDLTMQLCQVLVLGWRWGLYRRYQDRAGRDIAEGMNTILRDDISAGLDIAKSYNGQFPL